MQAGEGEVGPMRHDDERASVGRTLVDGATFEDQPRCDEAAVAREHRRERLTAGSLSAGDRHAVRAIRDSRESQLRDLDPPESDTAHGRLDMTNGERLFVGRQSIMDRNSDVLVVGWHAPAARPFYSATLGKRQDVARRRHLRTDGANLITGVEDEVFADLGETKQQLDDGPVLTDTLLSALEAERGSTMRDIVRTIQAAQYEIFAAPADRSLLVQGGPGTGKTAVALHRVSWLLHNNRGLAASDVVVVGPSETYSQYVSGVVSSLGHTGVRHVTLEQLVERPAGGRGLGDRLKGDPRMSQVLRTAAAATAQPPTVDALRIRTRTGSVEVDLVALAAKMRQLAAHATHVRGRAALREWLLEEVGARHGDPYLRTSVDPDVVNRVVDDLWPRLTPRKLVRSLLTDPSALARHAQGVFTADEQEALLSQKLGTLADAVLLDEAEAVLGVEVTQFGYVVVDEAQDLSPLAIRAVARRCAPGRLMLLGDLAQSTGDWTHSSWGDVATFLPGGEAGASLHTLPHGYRVPAQVAAMAAEILPRTGTDVAAPKPVRRGAVDPASTSCPAHEAPAAAAAQAADHWRSGLSTAVVTPLHLVEPVMRELSTREVLATSVEAGLHQGHVAVGTAASVKGLEFDAVVLVDPDAIADGTEAGHRLLYVALTRTTRILSVVHVGETA